MKPYAHDRFTEEELFAWHYVRELISRVPDEIDLGSKPNGDKVIISCHMLCHALHVIVPTLRVEDGYYCKGYEHSWLLTSRGNIIDAYPIATLGGPLLLDATSCPFPPAEELYQRDNQISAQVVWLQHQPWFKEAFAKLVRIMIEVPMRMFPSNPDALTMDFLEARKHCREQIYGLNRVYVPPALRVPSSDEEPLYEPEYGGEG